MVDCGIGTHHFWLSNHGDASTIVIHKTPTFLLCRMRILRVNGTMRKSSSSSSWLDACLPIASHRYRVPDNCSPSRPVRRNFNAGILPLPLPNIGSHPWGFQNGLQIFCHSSSPGLSHSPWWALPRCSLVEHQCLSGYSVLCHPEHMPAPFQAHLPEEWIQ